MEKIKVDYLYTIQVLKAGRLKTKWEVLRRDLTAREGEGHVALLNNEKHLPSG